MKICDKCGTSKRTAVGYNGKRLITINIREGFPKRNAYTYKRFELCVKCWKKYEKYLKRFFVKKKKTVFPYAIVKQFAIHSLLQKIEK
jgi:hypothetical protein